MSSNDNSTASPCALSIAGVRFALSNPPAAAAAWPESFRDFIGEACATDLACKVCYQGPDESLACEAPAPDAPWQFCAQDGGCELTRRAADGVALWRIRAPLGFDRAAIAWHPRRFPAAYGDPAAAWTSGLGLSLLVFRLRARGGLVLHGSAAALDGRGILCVGVSGVGKSTLARLLHAAGATVLTDERPAIRQWPPPTSETRTAEDAAFRVHGTPWPSSAGFARNACAPLRRIYFLEHGKADRLTALTPREAFNRLVHVTTIPWQDAALFDPCLKTLETLLRSVPCAALAFRPTPEVVDLIRNDLSLH
jgi:hypothetical protein